MHLRHAYPHSFSTAANTDLSLGRASILFDGVFSSPRLQHPEGVAIGPDGWIWCSSENGQILRIAPDGKAIIEVASTEGFTLGMAFDGDQALYVCDNKHKAIFKLSLANLSLSRFSSPGIEIPNYPVIDKQHNQLLVSDSYSGDEAGPGIWAYDLDTGEGKLWYQQTLFFANGMCLSVDGNHLYVCETFARRVLRIAINDQGQAAEVETYIDDLPGLPDGLAIDDDENLFIGCYEPSRILKVSAGSRNVSIYIEDPTAHLFCHPTNIAFDDNTLYSANLGRWHITQIETDTYAKPLYARSL